MIREALQTGHCEVFPLLYRILQIGYNIITDEEDKTLKGRDI